MKIITPTPPRGAYFVKNYYFCVVQHFDLTLFGVFSTIEDGSLHFVSSPQVRETRELYKRLIEKRFERRMPLGQPPLSPAAINTICEWILAGAPSWETPEQSGPFIISKEMLEAIEKHVNCFCRRY